MSELTRHTVFSSLSKGSHSTYRPDAGTRCLLSGPNEDDNTGYVFHETTILWRNDTFVLYGIEGYWPVLNKWDHVRVKPLESKSNEHDVGGAK